MRPPGRDESRTVPSHRLWELEELYRGRYDLDPLSYGTVRDWADSVDNFCGLARAAPDMKNLQRCWAVKAILGNVEPGGRLLEIGAGEPLVADLLSRLGYQVTVVDPYDGSGHGPLDFEEFAAAYPDVRFVRARFPTAAEPAGDLAAVYSISVLEHVPTEDVAAVVEAADACLAPGGLAIHAIDHVVAGWGAEEHLGRLREVVRAGGLSTGDLEAALERLREDPETYFVSAEAHQVWRGSLAYDDYPMRRIASVHLACRRAATVAAR